MKIFEDSSWLYNGSYDILATIFSTILIYLSVVILTRLNGLRTFAKMSSFDFAITIAIGSVIASTMILSKQSVVQGLVGLIMLVLLQRIVARLRKKSDTFEKVITNIPILLMDKDRILYENLKASRVTESDLYAKLREANVTNKKQILAVVLETTGDMSVLHSGTSSDTLEKDLLKYVVASPTNINLRASKE